MIRILHVVNSMNMGGIETLLMSIYRNIDRQIIQFDFLVSSKEKGLYEEEINKLGGRVFRVASLKDGWIKRKNDINNFFQKHEEYRIIHYHTDCLSKIDILKIAKKYNRPTIIVHCHNNNHSGFIHNILHRINKRKICRYATDYFTISQLASKWLFPKKVYENQIDVIVRNGIDVDKFLFNAEMRNEIKKELGLENKKVIGHIGRFAEQKNHLFLIDIFNEIHKLDSDTVLLLIGDGSLKKNIEEKVNNLNLKNEVIFLGIKSNAYDYMQAMDIFLFPSLFEGLGRVLIEAQACDLPCIASENVIPDETKILETYISVDLKEEPVLWAQKAIDAFNYSERKNRRKEIENAGFDIKTVTKQLEEFYLKKSKEG